MTGWVQQYFGKKVYFIKEDVRVSKIYFSDNELKCKCGCNGLKLNTTFDEKLTLLRQNVNAPMKVNSCCRCKKHNEAVGGNARSLHVFDESFHKTNGTCAIDVKREGGTHDQKLILEAWDSNWSIGVTSTFFHLDCRSIVLGMPQVMFAYSGITDPKDLAKWKRLVK